MLKIKKNVDLKELEKFGFIKLNILDDTRVIAKDVYCLVDDKYKCFIKNNCIDDYLVQYYFSKKRSKEYCAFPEERDETLIEDTDFELIKADLVEKVKENK